MLSKTGPFLAVCLTAWLPVCLALQHDETALKLAATTAAHHAKEEEFRAEEQRAELVVAELNVVKAAWDEVKRDLQKRKVGSSKALPFHRASTVFLVKTVPFLAVYQAEMEKAQVDVTPEIRRLWEELPNT
eukprot:SAG22_NODE_706_length_7763_cov_4.404228_2_plen_131_part_00